MKDNEAEVKNAGEAADAASDKNLISKDAAVAGEA